MTPEGDPSELEEGVRSRFLRLVEAGDESFARDEDSAAIESWTRALGLVAGQASPQLRNSLVARMVVAHARGGGARLALELLEELPEGSRESETLRFARARAHERTGEEGEVASLAAWFDAWAVAAREGNAGASHYARVRAASIWGRVVLNPARLGPVVEEMEDADARVCATRFAGSWGRDLESGSAELPSWVGSCFPGELEGRASGPKVGLLLPRSGRLAALADGHLAAISTAGRLVSADQSELVLEFRDAGSKEASAVAGAEELLAAGVTVIVGPVGARQSRAVAKAVAGRARVITPGPATGLAEGVAPTLEDRVARLAAEGLRLGCQGRWILLHAEGAYGKRGARHFNDLGGTSEYAGLISEGQPQVLTYPPSQTSFATLLRKLPGPMRAGRCVMVIDTLARTSAIARQIRREGGSIADSGIHFFSTAEGLDARALAGERALAGTIVSPIALPAARSAFQDSFHLATGHAADDQALLLWSALRLALWQDDGSAETGQARVAQLARFDEEGVLDVSTKE
jgi:ABC-type branched-subunit amino acid transport system substrate-binding protein